MDETAVTDYRAQWQRAALQHRRAIWSLIHAGEHVEVRMETAKHELLRLRVGAGRAVAVADDELALEINRLQGSLVGAEAEYRRIARATYAHLQALRVLQRQLNPRG
jgi:hypothetical protein